MTPAQESSDLPEREQFHAENPLYMSAEANLAKAPEVIDPNVFTGEGHPVLETHLREMDDVIAQWHASNDSRIQDRALSSADWRILKGDAGEGRTYVELLDRYPRERIIAQASWTEADGMKRKPDFCIASEADSSRYVEIVDAKAWALLRPEGYRDDDPTRLRHLLDHPSAPELTHMRQLQSVVERYSGSTRLEEGGKIVLYFPEDVMRYAPQIQTHIEGWSGTGIAHGHPVEVRSMGVWPADLRDDVSRRWSQQH